MAIHHFVMPFDVDLIHIRGREAMFGLQVLQGLQRTLGGAVAGKPLQEHVHAQEGLAQTLGQFAQLKFITEHAKESELALENVVGAIEPAVRKVGRHHAAFVGATQMQPLDHSAGP